MKKLYISLLVALLVLVPFSGNAAIRMSDMSIVCGLGIDGKTGHYTVTVQYLNLYKGSGKSDGITGNITATASGKGKTVEDAVKSVQKTLSDRLFFGQTEVLVLGEDTVKEEMREFIIRCPYLRHDVMLVRAAATAAKVLENPARGAVVPAGSLVKQIKDCPHAASINDWLKDENITLPVAVTYEKYCIVR